MKLIRQTVSEPPAVTAAELDEARAWWRQSQTVEADRHREMVSGARRAIEAYTGRFWWGADRTIVSTLELDGAQPRRPLPNGRLGPAKATTLRECSIHVSPRTAGPACESPGPPRPPARADTSAPNASAALPPKAPERSHARVTLRPADAPGRQFPVRRQPLAPERRSYRRIAGRLRVIMDGHSGAETSAPDSVSRQALRLLVDHQPERHDLAIGFVGAIGTAWTPILRAFEDSLSRFDYVTKTVQVVGLLDELPYRPWDPLPDRTSRDYYEKMMTAGDVFRAATRNGAALAALAVRDIEQHSSERAQG